MSISDKKQYIFLVLILTILTSCQLIMKLPEKDQLYEKVQLLYTAEQEEDFSEWTKLEVPQYNKEQAGNQNSSGNGFFESRDFRLVSWKIISIKQVDPPTYIEGAREAVAISMDVRVERNGVEKKVNDLTDYWVLLGGDWYWFWRGFPND